jgi:hypothetical protein
MREVQAHGCEPLPYTGFAGVNLLASADQTHDDRSGFVPIEIRDEEVGF